MGLRDIAVLVAVYGSIPFALKKPFIGVLVWIWLSLMNPHRISWELSNAQLAQVVAIVMLFSLLISRTEEKKIPWNAVTALLAFWWFWIFLTTIYAMNPSGAWGQWDTVWKTLLTTFVIVVVLNTKERLLAAVVVMVLSVGFYGFKGGFFTIVTGGNYRVWGPPGSFLGGNNEIGLALIMIMPLLFYVRSRVNLIWLRSLLLLGLFLCFAAILGTHSRGAFVGIVAMAMLLAARSPNRLAYFMLLLGALPFALFFMPEQWAERMASIREYQTDASAMGRINAWWMAWYLALDNPILGAGLQGFTLSNFILYAPNPGRAYDAHSVYFEVLGEQGFAGLAIFLAIGIAALAKASKIRRGSADSPELKWLFDLVTAVQLAILGYAVSGVFLGLAYFDFYYMLIALIIGADVVYKRSRAADVRDKWVVQEAPGTVSATPTEVPASGRWSRGGSAGGEKLRLREIPRFVLGWYRRL